jgi:nicotinamide-nucleotide amidase
MRALIVSIGDELLIGQTINTNAAWMGEQLSAFGIQVAEVSTISDNQADIQKALRKGVEENFQLVLITGGLGPTKDDITKKTIAAFFNQKLVQNQEVLDNVYALFNAYGREVKPVNIDQALVPEGCEVLINNAGTAPGMWIEHNGTIFVSMPGVPKEMRYLMEKRVLPKLQDEYALPVLVNKTMLTQGIGESEVAERIEDIEDGLPSHIKLAYLPSAGMVKLRLSGKGEDKILLTKEIDTLFDKILPHVEDHFFGWDKETIEGNIVEKLKLTGRTLASAESFTGGNIGAAITTVPGASQVYKGGVVAYTNEIKQHVLGVDPNDLEKYSAVSEQVIEQMAIGVRKKFNSDYGIATSGIAGPDGGTEEIPVGTVWIAIAYPNGIWKERFQLGKGRTSIVKRGTRMALNKLLKMLVSGLKE